MSSTQNGVKEPPRQQGDASTAQDKSSPSKVSICVPAAMLAGHRTPPKRTISLFIAGIATAMILAPAPAWGRRGADPLPPPHQVPLQVPDGYDPAVPAPLLILLHGRTFTGPQMEAFLGLANHANTHGYFYSLPTGNVDGTGQEYWNGTVCCDADGDNPDHVGYVTSIIDHMEATYSIDPRRIHLLGYSNGGHLAHRMACELPDRLASIICIAGVTWDDPAQCAADGVVHVAQVHGTNDQLVLYEGNDLTGYPSVDETVAQWVDKLACDPVGVDDPSPLDFTSDVPGAETLITRYEACPPGASVELWKVVGEDHFMSLTEAGRSAIFDYFDTHRAPCTGDLDGSGQTGFGDLTQLLSAWGPCAGCPEDLDGNDVVGFADLVIVLSNWGPCE